MWSVVCVRGVCVVAEDVAMGVVLGREAAVVGIRSDEGAIDAEALVSQLRR